MTPKRETPREALPRALSSKIFRTHGYARSAGSAKKISTQLKNKAALRRLSSAPLNRKKLTAV